MLGDLHPHVMVIPFFISAILIILSSTALILHNTLNMKVIIPSFFVGMLIAACSFINLWSLPICIAIYFGIIGLSFFAESNTRLRKKYGVQVLVTLVTSSLLIETYLIGIQSSITALQKADIQTRLIHGLIIWAPLFSINIPFVVQVFFMAPISSHWKLSLIHI